jgi:hypothetical protein
MMPCMTTRPDAGWLSGRRPRRTASACALVAAIVLAPASTAHACPQCAPEVRSEVHAGIHGGFTRDLVLMGLPFIATLGLAATLLRSAMRRVPR